MLFTFDEAKKKIYYGWPMFLRAKQVGYFCPLCLPAIGTFEA